MTLNGKKTNQLFFFITSGTQQEEINICMHRDYGPSIVKLNDGKVYVHFFDLNQIFVVRNVATNGVVDPH
jgi:hypothetical protein